jgi:hypothetical protein
VLEANMPNLLRFVGTTLLTVSAWSQAISTSEIRGTIHDTTGAVLSGAEVKLTQTATQAVRTATSDAQGLYIFSALPVGPYRLEVTRAGFAGHVQTGIVLQVASNPTIDVTLTLGSVRDRVTVEANAGLVDTQSAGIGQVIDSKRVLELPLIGRNVTDLITLAGAATAASNPQLNTSRNYPTAAISVAGGLGSGTAFVLDGAMHNDVSNGLTLPLPFPDALQEFKVETSALPAQYGLHSAAAVTAITKSGSNQWHGGAFEFVRNYRFNARNFFAAERDSLKRNQFGGTLGGPIRKNKVFAFGAYQGTISRQSAIPNTMFIPTEAALRGDFTGLASAACNGGTARVLRGPFAENRVPPSQLSAVAVNLSSKLPPTSDPCGRITFGVANISDDRQGVGRADFHVAENHTLFGRYLAANLVAPDPYSLNANVLQTGAVNGTSFGQDILAQSFALGDTYVVSARTVNSLRGAFNRTAVQRVASKFFSAPDLGVNMHSYYPKFISLNVPGFFSIGTNTSTDATYQTNTYHMGDDLRLTRGSHQISLGGSFARLRFASVAGVFGAGIFTFSGAVTGNALADLMLGNVANFQQAAPAPLYLHQNYIGIYAQDSWRVRRGLTLSYGLRWEPHLPPQIDDGHISHIDLQAFVEGRRTTVFRNAPNGIFYPTDPGFPSNSSVNRHWKQFAPRFGLAWDPTGDGRMAIRASWGIFYDTTPAQTHLGTIAVNPWVGRVLLAGVNFANPWQNQSGGNPFPLPPIDGNATFVPGGTFINWDYDMRPPSVQARNLTIERQIRTNWLLSASYIGSQTIHLISLQAFNPAVFLGNTPMCTVNGITIAACNTAASTAQRRKMSLLNPAQGRFFGDVGYGDFGGTANYNGLLLAVQRRFGQGITVNANYTWSHCISDYIVDSQWLQGQGYTNPGNRRFDRGNCNTSATDRRQILNVSSIVETPRLSRRWANVLAGGWRVSTIISGQTGPALNVTTGSVDVALSGIANQRPNQLSPNVYGSGHQRFLDSSAFALPAVGTLGNSGAGSILGPGFVTVNGGLARTLRVSEGQTLELRIEASNVLNTVNFGNPNTNVGTSTFGQITSTAAGQGSGFVSPGDARIMQFAIKYAF